jgi:proton-dependent oligopeptide transporter, POT family
MVHRLLLPGQAEHVAGFGVYQRLINSIYGNLSMQPLASAMFGHYTSFVYLTPIAGG